MKKPSRDEMLRVIEAREKAGNVPVKEQNIINVLKRTIELEQNGAKPNPAEIKEIVDMFKTFRDAENDEKSATDGACAIMKDLIRNIENNNVEDPYGCLLEAIKAFDFATRH